MDFIFADMSDVDEIIEGASSTCVSHRQRRGIGEELNEAEIDSTAKAFDINCMNQEFIAIWS
jgi:hypothetical protein